ncbi:hypothetical protein B0T16DRAFT_314830 [Cercophora newfieldiana]|uniref:Aminoglycoside phosphotransferase domain-containing protein n=1 Tax=Cercophora newfieldiana TaxID=92897 RepID=A0AA39YP55_9PEZI|nr:hypothetical protein B0T16DRAFT_314830 [Cercophora newfieldiana]
MPTTVLLDSRRPITLESALKKDSNIISEAAHAVAAADLSKTLWDNRLTISGLVKHHLGLNAAYRCAVAPPERWIKGSFNICIPVRVSRCDAHTSSAPADEQTLIFRCAMPHKIAQGSVDEKLGCEVGTYAWMQSHCPEVRIPHLYGFGFSDHRHFTHEGRMPFYVRFWHTIRRRLRYVLGSVLGFSGFTGFLSHYAAHPASHLRLPAAYTLLEYIGPDTGRMLSETWKTHRDDQHRRQRLFQGLSRILLSLARVPQPRIGSFHFSDDGMVTLTNRPLLCNVAILENDGAPRTIDETYPCVEPFVADLLDLHDGHFLANQNAVEDANDCRCQMAYRTLLRTLSYHFVRGRVRSRRRRNDGPFHLQLTDFHQSNIFIDDDWNVTCLIDLEWVCALPAEMLAVPYWLTGLGIDELVDDKLVEFNSVHQQFISVLKEVEEEEGGVATLSSTIHDSWESGAVWFWYSLDSVNAMLTLVEDHIITPQFGRMFTADVEVLSKYWCQGSREVVNKKVADHDKYVEELELLFDPSSGDGAAPVSREC